MRIVHCLTNSDLGGGQVAVFQLVKSLRRWYPDMEIAVALPPGGVFVNRFQQLDVEVHEFHLDKISPIQFVRLLLFLQKFQPDVVHSHGKGAGLYVRSIPRKLLPAKRFHSHHGFHPLRFLGSESLFYRLESFLLKATDSVIAVSPSEQNELAIAFPREADRIVVIPNVVDPEQVFRDASRSLPGNMDSFLKQNTSSFIGAMIARDDPIKNYSLAFEAVRVVLRTSDKTAFLFIGVSETNAQFLALRATFPDRIFGVSSYDSPAAAVNRSHCVWLTSRKEGGAPLVIQEAFCLGKPVIATNVGGIKDIVRHRENGLLCDESPQALSNAILELAGNRQLYSQLSAMASETSRTFDQRKWAERYYHAYKGNE